LVTIVAFCEGVTGSGFEIGFKGEGPLLAGESGGEGDAEGGVGCGRWIIAAVVLKEAPVEVAREAGVAEGGSGAALKAIDVVPVAV
jgi:hypothetical protein